MRQSTAASGQATQPTLTSAAITETYHATTFSIAIMLSWPYYLPTYVCYSLNSLPVLAAVCSCTCEQVQCRQPNVLACGDKHNGRLAASSVVEDGRVAWPHHGLAAAAAKAAAATELSTKVKGCDGGTQVAKRTQQADEANRTDRKRFMVA